MSSEQKSGKRVYLKVPEFSAGDIKVSIEAQHMKNFKSVILFIKLNVKDAKSDAVSVLNALIAQYARNHDMGVGISSKTNIMKVIPGFASIYIMTDEHHVLPNIKLFYKYIIEKKLDNPAAVKTATNYEAVKQQITGIHATVYGKCQSFIKKFPEGNAKTDKLTPIKSLETGLVFPKSATGAIPVNNVEQPELGIGTQDVQARLMVAIILADIPFVFDANNIKFTNVTDMERAKMILHDRKTNIIVLKRFIEQMKPEFEKDVPTSAFITRFKIFAKIMFNMKGTNNECGNDTVKLFIEACKGRTNMVLTNLSKVK